MDYHSDYHLRDHSHDHLSHKDHSPSKSEELHADLIRHLFETLSDKEIEKLLRKKRSLMKKHLKQALAPIYDEFDKTISELEKKGPVLSFLEKLEAHHIDNLMDHPKAASLNPDHLKDFTSKLTTLKGRIEHYNRRIEQLYNLLRHDPALMQEFSKLVDRSRLLHLHERLSHLHHTATKSFSIEE